MVPLIVSMVALKAYAEAVTIHALYFDPTATAHEKMVKLFLFEMVLKSSNPQTDFLSRVRLPVVFWKLGKGPR